MDNHADEDGGSAAQAMNDLPVAIEQAAPEADGNDLDADSDESASYGAYDETVEEVLERANKSYVDGEFARLEGARRSKICHGYQETTVHVRHAAALKKISVRTVVYDCRDLPPAAAVDLFKMDTLFSILFLGLILGAKPSIKFINTLDLGLEMLKCAILGVSTVRRHGSLTLAGGTK